MRYDISFFRKSARGLAQEVCAQQDNMYVQCAAVHGSCSGDLLNLVTLPQTMQSCILKILIMVVIPEHD